MLDTKQLKCLHIAWLSLAVQNIENLNMPIVKLQSEFADILAGCSFLDFRILNISPLESGNLCRMSQSKIIILLYEYFRYSLR